MRKITLGGLPLEQRLMALFIVNLAKEAIKNIQPEYVDPDMLPLVHKMIDNLNELTDLIELD